MKKFSIIPPFKKLCDPSKKSESMNNVPIEAKYRFNEINVHKTYLVMTCTTVSS